MFYKKDDLGYKEPVEGVKLKTLTYGEKTLMAEFRIKKGGALPEHSHPHEQVGYMVEGEAEFVIQGKSYQVQAGQMWRLPGGVAHKVVTGQRPMVALDVFYPVREDLRE